jgi:hypothetical protein
MQYKLVDPCSNYSATQKQQHPRIPRGVKKKPRIQNANRTNIFFIFFPSFLIASSVCTCSEEKERKALD